MRTPLAYIPAWRGDETLYSWVAAFQVVLGNGSSRDTGALLFGAKHACRERDAPTNLQHFVEVTRGELGTVSSLLLTRTSLGLFAPFLPSSRQQVLSDHLVVAKGLGWRLLCGMPASCLIDPTVQHFCDACVAEDVRIWGLPRWRLAHQLAGAWICLNHGRLLQRLKTTASQWHLPPSEASGKNTMPLAPAQAAMLTRMAKLALKLSSTEHLDVTAIRQAVLTGLRDSGVTNWAHPMDKSLLASWFAQSPIATWIRSSHGPAQRLASGSWVHDLLRNRVGDHPLKWMLLWCALFATEDDEASHQRFINPGSAPHWDTSGQGTIWGTSCATVPPDIQRVITEAATLKEAADKLGLNVITLRRRLAELGTNARAFRLDTSFAHRKKRAMDSISNYIAEHPSCARVDIHRHCKAAVEWIRLNDPELFSIAVGSIDHQQSRQLQLLPSDAL
jgi:hypothetical protein